MRTLKYFLAFVVAGGFTFLLPGCRDDVKYDEGRPTDPNSPGVYFDSSNAGVGEVEDDDEYLYIAVSRLKTQSALTVPIQVNYSANGLSFPDQSVSFAAGEETAYFRVAYDKGVLELEEPYYFGLSMDHSYTDPYNSEIPGTAIFTGSLKRLEPWVLVANTNCSFEATSGSEAAKFGDFEQKLYKKELAGYYKFANWCLNNTDEYYGDFIFTVENKTITVDNSIGYHGYSGRWYFYLPWADSDSSSWQINGHLPNEAGIYMTYFYLYTSGSSSLMEFDEEAKTAVMQGYSRYSSVYSSGSFRLTYTW